MDGVQICQSSLFNGFRITFTILVTNGVTITQGWHLRPVAPPGPLTAHLGCQLPLACLSHGEAGVHFWAQLCSAAPPFTEDSWGNRQEAFERVP